MRGTCSVELFRERNVFKEVFDKFAGIKPGNFAREHTQTIDFHLPQRVVGDFGEDGGEPFGVVHEVILSVMEVG